MIVIYIRNRIFAEVVFANKFCNIVLLFFLNSTLLLCLLL